MSEIQGITFKRNDEKSSIICYVDDFSDELKNEVRSMLSGIFHGKKNAVENEDIHGYKSTISNFLERYQNQTKNTQKGMIGELLVHLLIPRYIEHMESISIFKNKEEQSIKKGFDVVYFDKSKLWYCEVKSGGDVSKTTADEHNIILLDRAKNQIKETAICKRSTLWDSVLMDVHLTIFNEKKQLKIKELLKNDHPNIENRNLNRNVILSSVLYKHLDDRVDFDKVVEYRNNLLGEDCFSELIVFSIQKHTYKKIEEFLISELSVI